MSVWTLISCTYLCFIPFFDDKAVAVSSMVCPYWFRVVSRYSARGPEWVDRFLRLLPEREAFYFPRDFLEFFTDEVSSMLPLDEGF